MRRESTSLHFHLSARGVLLHFFLGHPGVSSREDLPAIGVVGEAKPIGAVVVGLLLGIDHGCVIPLRSAFDRAGREPIADRALSGFHVLLWLDPRPARRHPLRRFKRCAVFVVGVQQLDRDPAPFEEAQWVTPGWPWVDPEKDMKAAERAIRDGLSTRSIECAAQGYDAAVIDAEQKADNDRADRLGLSYDSDGRKILIGRNAGLTEAEVSDEAASGKVEVA